MNYRAPRPNSAMGSLYLRRCTALAGSCFLRHKPFDLFVQAWALGRPSKQGAGPIPSCLRICSQEHGGMRSNGFSGLGVNFLDSGEFDEALCSSKLGYFASNVAKRL